MLAKAVQRTPETADRPTEERDALSREEVFHILSNDRRRYLLHHLIGQEDGSVGVRETSRQIAAWENGVALNEVTAPMRRRVYVALHQTHIPQLRDANVVEYSESQSALELSEGASDLRMYLEVVEEEEIPWSGFYLGLGTLCLAVTALVWIDLPPFGTIPDVAWAGAIAAAFTIIGTIHTYTNRGMRLGDDGPPPGVEARE